jgi:AcrR family transcriptional regulator
VIVTRGNSLEAPLGQLRKVKTEEPASAARNSDQEGIARIVKETLNALNGTETAADGRGQSRREEIVRALTESKGRVGGAAGAAARLGINRTTLLHLLATKQEGVAQQYGELLEDLDRRYRDEAILRLQQRFGAGRIISNPASIVDAQIAGPELMLEVALLSNGLSVDSLVLTKISNDGCLGKPEYEIPCRRAANLRPGATF